MFLASQVFQLPGLRRRLSLPLGFHRHAKRA